MQRNKLAGATILALVSISLTVGCQRPPELPPADSMSFLEFKKGTAKVEPAAGSDTGSSASALTQESAQVGFVDMGGSTRNVETAALAVGLVSLGVHAALFWPRAFFWGALSAQAERDGDAWVWSKTFPLAGWQATLRAEHKERLDLEMRVTGLRGEQTAFQNFLWYTGSHDLDDGQWVVFAKEVTGPVLNIDWARRSATDKTISFTNVTQGQPGSGDKLGYALLGNIASMTVHDARNDQGVPADFSVSWDTVEGEGKIVRGAESLCWDTLAKGQVDIPCPASAWPTP
jgi:hypothetical protein